MEGLFFPLVLAWALPGTFPHAHQPRAATWAAVERGSAGGVVASCGRRSGMLCVGLAGNNGVTLVAAQLANQRRLTWESDRRGPQQASLLGCITQVGQLAERYAGLDAFCDMAIGGWDIRALPLGQGLYESRILDYDLVRQLRDEMDQTAVMPGVWDASFIGDSQHEGATHTVPAAPKAELLDHLRGDIRRWREAEEVRGHVTLVWSASVERPSQFEPQTAEALLAAIRSDEPEVSPSLLYATAAVLEGCSFINGGSQNTLQPGLLELASQQPSPVYVLGTDFKAGQTKAKTALVEYLRAIGLRLSTVASYNHLGNNDMRNLLSPSTWKAKARVKSDIFGAWVGAPRSPGAEEGSGANAGAADGSVRAAFKPQNNLDTQIDHKVAVLFTEAMGDEKRDTVEYTSLAFMGCEHTMLTYTRCMDSALCVPLMIDAVVFADYFAARGVAASEVACGLAYLFKINEGAARGVDPGFFAQSATLARLLDSLPRDAPEQVPATAQAQDASSPPSQPSTSAPPPPALSKSETDSTPDRTPAVPPNPPPAPPRYVGSVACVGVVCLDMQLLGAEQPTSREAIARFGKVEAKAGGSASNTGSSLAAAGVSVSVVAKIGNDLHGDEMMRQWQAAGMHTELVSRDEGLSTSTAVLPVYTDGGRGCWIDLSANDALNADAVLAALAPSRPTASSPDEHQPEQAPAAPPVAAVHIGYPHLLQSLRGAVLSSLFDALSRQLDGVLLSVDVNGVSPDSEEDVLGPAMWGIDLLHANMEEARIIAFAGGSDAEDDEAAPTSSQSGDAEAAEEPSSLEDDLPELRRIADQMHRRGVAVLGVTLGSRGAFVSAHPDQARLRRVPQLDRATAGWCGADLLLPSPPVRGSVNANGAGDAFTAGMLASLIRQEPGSLEEALREAQESARRRISGEDAPKE